MKILKIFGVVVAVHAVGFMFVFAIPGCRSTTRQVSPALAADTNAKPGGEMAPVDHSAASAPASQPAASPVVNNADLNPGVTPPASSAAMAADTGIHFNHSNPTRPGTPQATALETAPTPEALPTKTYVVAKGDSLGAIAKKNGVTVKELQAANNLKNGAVLVTGKKLIIPTKAPVTAAASQAILGTGNPLVPTAASTPVPAGAGETITYEVKSGDVLQLIAKHAGTTVSAIKNLNKLTSDKVRVGQKLLIPANATNATAMAAAHDTNAAATAASASAAPTPTSGDLQTHKLTHGETLGSVAKMFGVKAKDLGTFNNIADPRTVREGQTLKIPPASKSKPSSSHTASTPATAPTAAPITNPATNQSPISPATPGPASPTTPDTSSPLSAPSADTPPPVNRVEDPNAPTAK